MVMDKETKSSLMQDSRRHGNGQGNKKQFNARIRSSRE
jgi:hypothetical protein